VSAGDRIAAITSILRTAHACGWRVALLRPRGSLAGDADGAPNVVLAHGGAGRVWHVRLHIGPLTENEQAWGETLIRAGTVWRSVAIPRDIDQLLADLADSVKPT
jgi:hypothetical protein